MANDPPRPMDMQEKMRMRAAAYRTKKVLPPGIAELVAREFINWEEFGWRLGQSSIVLRAVDEVMKMQTPTPERLADNIQ